MEKGYDTYADFSMTRPSHTVDLEKIELSKKFVESIQHHRGKCKWAFYAPDDYAYSYALMFATLSEDLLTDDAVFQDKNRAYEWLNIKVGT
jgi:hypothetical protein